MKLKDIKVDTLDTIGKYISKYRLPFMLILILVSLAETALIVSGLMTYDFSNWKNVIYLVAYILLAFFSLTILVILIIDKTKGVKQKSLAILSQSYGLFLIIWGTLVSYLDITLNYYPVAFLSVLVCVASIVILNPYVYTATTLIGYSTIIVLDYVFGKKFLNISDYFNITVFFIMSVFISFRQHLSTINNEKTKKYLEKLSFEDQVTGYGNESAFVSAIEQIENEIAVKKSKFSVFVLEVNKIDEISDVYGYKYVVSIINTIGHLIKQLFNDSTIYRIQGNEFVIISKSNDYQLLDTIKEKIDNTIIGSIVSYEDIEFHISVSYGVSKFKIGDSFNDVFKRATKLNNEMKNKNN